MGGNPGRRRGRLCCIRTGWSVCGRACGRHGRL